jgi:hypothetical protein
VEPLTGQSEGSCFTLDEIEAWARKARAAGVPGGGPVHCAGGRLTRLIAYPLLADEGAAMPSTDIDPAAAVMARRRYGPAQPKLEAAMAVTVWACAYPPAAYALRAWARLTGTPATPDRWLPAWTAAVTGDPGPLRRAAGQLGGYHGAYPAADRVDATLFGSAWSSSDLQAIRAACVTTTIVMLLASSSYMGTLSGWRRDAWTAHHAATAGAALGAGTLPVTYEELRAAHGRLLGELQDTPAGHEVLTGVLAADDIGGWPGELLAARSRWLMPAAVTAVLGVAVPVFPGSPGEYAEGCPWC